MLDQLRADLLRKVCPERNILLIAFLLRDRPLLKQGVDILGASLSLCDQCLFLRRLGHVTYSETGSALGGIVVTELFNCIGEPRRRIFSVRGKRLGDELL